MAAHDPNTRRALLHGLAGAIPAVTVSQAAAAAGDVQLKALFAHWKRQFAELGAFTAGSDEELDRLMDGVGDVEREIFAHPATGVEALKIKVEVAKQYLNPLCGDGVTIDCVAFQAVCAGIAAL